MKRQICLVILLLVFSCTNEKQETPSTLPPLKVNSKFKQVHQKGFQQVLDLANLKGAILIYNPQKEIYYSNNFTWAKHGQLPASTFKIPNSMIALETGVVKNRQTPFKWDGKKRHLKIWEKDMNFNDAFRVSCLPCYREIAKKVGVDRMNDWLSKLDYGKSFKANSSNLDFFWIAGNWEVTLFDQIDFLSRLYNSQLAISKRTERIVKEMMVNERNDQFILRGKTGWSIQEETNNGWFVGYLEKKEKVYFFATNVEPDEGFDMKKFPGIRKEVTMEALKIL